MSVFWFINIEFILIMWHKLNDIQICYLLFYLTVLPFYHKTYSDLRRSLLTLFLFFNIRGKTKKVNSYHRLKAGDGGFAEGIRPISSCGRARLQAETVLAREACRGVPYH